MRFSCCFKFHPRLLCDDPTLALITLRQSEEILNHYSEHPRSKREPVSLTLAVLLGVGGVAAGIGTGASAMVQVNINSPSGNE